MAKGPYQPIELKDFSGGLVSSKDQESDSLELNESPDLLNVDFGGKGSFEIRRGYELFADRGVAGSVTRGWVFRRPIQNDEIPMAQFYDNTNYTLKYYHSGTGNWETVPIVGTIDSKLGFANYTSSSDTVDYVYYCDGTIALQRWNGGHTLLNGVLAGGEATITVDSTAGFTVTGSIDIGGSTVTYTGKTATTFTGCAGTPAAADDDPVEQLADNFAASSGSKPSGNILEIFNSQLCVASDQFVSISDVDDFTDWGSGLADSQATNGSQAFTGGSITGLKAKDNKLVVFTKDLVSTLEYEFTGDLTGFQIRKENIEETSGYGSKVFTGLVRADNEIYYMGDDDVIRRLVRSPVSALFDTGSVSENIRNLLATYTNTDTSSFFHKNKLYFVTCSPESDINDTIFVFDLKYARRNPSGEAWTRYEIYANDFFVFGGQLYFCSSAEQAVFRLFEDSNGDDILDDDGAAIPWYYTTPYVDFGASYRKYRVRGLVNRGFISTNAEITYEAIYDYGTNSSPQEQFLGSDSDVFVPESAESIGEGPLGEEMLAGEDQDPFDGQYPFVHPFDLGIVDFYTVQMKVSGNTNNERYRQTRMVLYTDPQDDDMTV